MDKLIFILIILFSYSVFSGNKTDKEEYISDPTRPYYLSVKTDGDQKKHPDKKLKLTAVFFKHGMQQVIINSALYQLGDFISNKKIIEITFNSITLSENGNSITLYLTIPFKKKIQ